MTTTMKITMMMVVVVVCVSAASLGGSRRDDMKAAGSELLTENRENVSTSVVFFRLDSHKDDNKTQDDSKTRLESHKDVNETLDSTRDAPSNSSMNITTFLFVFPLNDLGTAQDLRTECLLSTCLTANLGSSMQHGDETAGSSTSDPHGAKPTPETERQRVQLQALTSLSEQQQQQQNRTENNDPNETKLTLLATGASGGRVGIAAPPPCQLSICAVMNLGHKLQAGGDELAGQSSSDPYGHGK